MLTDQPDKMFVTKNVGPLFMGSSQTSVVVCQEPAILAEQANKFTFKKLKNNVLYEISDECAVSET